MVERTPSRLGSLGRGTDSRGGAGHCLGGRVTAPDHPFEADQATTDAVARWAGEQLAERIGIKITEWDPDRMVATMPVAHNRQPFGLLHGGASAVLAETLGSLAAGLWSRPDGIALGVELSCTHHRAATEGEVTGVCRPLHRGRTVATYEIVISDNQDRRICTARLTCLIRKHAAE